MHNITTKLDQLTSLRFFAAAMIVVLHIQVLGLFGIPNTKLAWGQGVSFFYVLSGFILTYVYPSLEADGAVARFWRARIARLWPAHLATFALGFWLLSYQWETATALANVLMVHSWIPLSKYFFSYNAVSWSISVELLFYLSFPLLISNFSRNWWVKLAVSGALVVVLALLCDSLQLPDLGNEWSEAATVVVTRQGVLVNNPLARLFEFVFGMCVALAWRRSESSAGPWAATACELGAVALCALSVLYSPALAREWQSSWQGSPGIALWISHSGSVFAFGLLIWIMARGRGRVSRVLAHPGLVLLGEISFSIYLVHQILLIYWKFHLVKALPDPLALIVFVAILLLVSYLLWVYVEMPGRRLIVGGAKIHGSGIMVDSWRANGPRSWRALAAMAALLVTGAIVAYEVAHSRDAEKSARVAARDGGVVTPDALKAYVGTNFGALFTLRGISASCQSDGMHLQLAWQSKATHVPPYTTAVHVIDAAGNILAQADHRQSLGTPSATIGAITVDTVVIPPGAFMEGTAALGLALFDASVRLLPIDRGPTDWDGRRLIVPVGRCPPRPPT